jgi:hypothetical protein
MKNSKIAWFPLLCLLAALVWASGCAVFGRKGQAAVIDKAQSDLYSEKPSVADNAALLLLATDTDSAYRVLRAALAEKNSPTTRAAVIRAFTSRASLTFWRVQKATSPTRLRPRCAR